MRMMLNCKMIFTWLWPPPPSILSLILSRPLFIIADIEGLRSLFVQEQSDWQQTAVQRSDSVVVASVKIFPIFLRVVRRKKIAIPSSYANE